MPAGEGPAKWFSGDVCIVKLEAENTNGTLGLIEAPVPPGGGPPPHIHHRADETFYLLNGALGPVLDCPSPRKCTAMRVFVAGASGFIGSALVRDLITADLEHADPRTAGLGADPPGLIDDLEDGHHDS